MWVVAKEWHSMRKIGIFSGTFDPVHKGHIAFALQAVESANLDKVYFVAEPKPRRKDGVTHYAHRVAMLRLALKPYKKLDVLDLPDRQFTVGSTLPRLHKLFPKSKLHLLIGSDVALNLSSGNWQGTDVLLKEMKLVVGMRRDRSEEEVVTSLQGLIPDRSFYLVRTDNEHISSSEIRLAIKHGKRHAESLKSLEDYIKRNWIYASLEALPNSS